MADETVRLVLDVTGVQDIEALKKEMLALTTAMGATDTQLGQVSKAAATTAQAVAQTTQAAQQAAPAVAAVGVAATTTAQAVTQVGQASFQATTAMTGVGTAAVQTTVAVTHAGQAAAQAAAQLNQLGNAAQNAAGGGGGGGGGAGGGAGGGGRGGGRGILNLSYALQDLYQGGFSAILNNIPMLAESFGVAAGTAGTLAIAGLAVNEAFKILGPLLKDTKIELKELGEVWEEFITKYVADSGEFERLTNEMKEAATEFGTSMWQTWEQSNDAFDKLLAKGKEWKELQKETAKDRADRNAGEAMLDKIDEGAPEKERGAMYKEYIEGQGGDAARAKQDALAKDMREKARKELVDQEMNALERNGAFKGSTLLGFDVSTMSEDMRRDFARNQIDNRRKSDDAETIDRSKEMAAGTMAAAARGDKKALAQIAAADKEFAEYEAEVAADAEAQKVHAKWREKRIEREKREMEENDRQKKLAEVGPPEEAFRRNVAGQRQAEEREAERAAEKKKIEQKIETEKNEAKTKARREGLDRFMQQEGLTPEGLFAQQEAAAARMPNNAMRNEARARVAGQQAAELRARMARRGMNEDDVNANIGDIRNAGMQRVPQRRGMRSVAPAAENNRTPAAEKTEENTKEVANAGDKMVRAVAQNGQVTLQKFQQIESTMLELSRMMAQNAGGMVGMPGRQFNAGRR